MFINTLMSAEADAVCGAAYGTTSPDRTNRRNGYRAREFDTRAGTLDLVVPKLRTGTLAASTAHSACRHVVLLRWGPILGPLSSEDRSRKRPSGCLQSRDTNSALLAIVNADAGSFGRDKHVASSPQLESSVTVFTRSPTAGGGSLMGVVPYRIMESVSLRSRYVSLTDSMIHSLESAAQLIQIAARNDSGSRHVEHSFNR